MGIADLVRDLDACTPLTPAAAFVVLWTFLDSPELTEAENAVPQALTLKPRAELAGAGCRNVERHHKTLTSMKNRADGLRFVLEWLRALDQDLPDAVVGAAAMFRGFGGKPYHLRPRFDFVPRHLGAGIEPAARQGRTLRAHARRFVVLPVDAVGTEPNLLPLGRDQWGTDWIHTRLLATRNRLRILVASLDDGPRYAVTPDGNGNVLLRTPTNVAVLEREVLDAVEAAREEKATVLVLPELCLPESVETALRADLARAFAEDVRTAFPLLTVFGRCHAVPTGSSDHVNAGVLLGPDGEDAVGDHHKLVKFVMPAPPPEGGEVGEEIVCGNLVTALESDVGNLVRLICMDLLNGEVQRLVERLGGALLLVPSMSRETGTHLKAAGILDARAQHATFCANIWPLDPTSAEARKSFFRVPGASPREVVEQPSAGPRLLLFRL